MNASLIWISFLHATFLSSLLARIYFVPWRKGFIWLNFNISWGHSAVLSIRTIRSSGVHLSEPSKFVERDEEKAFLRPKYRQSWKFGLSCDLDHLQTLTRWLTCGSPGWNCFGSDFRSFDNWNEKQSCFQSVGIMYSVSIYLLFSSVKRIADPLQKRFGWNLPWYVLPMAEITLTRSEISLQTKKCQMTCVTIAQVIACCVDILLAHHEKTQEKLYPALSQISYVNDTSKITNFL